MQQDANTDSRIGWVEASGCTHIFRTLRMAVSPGQLGIAFVSIVLTLILGGVLDFLWLQAGAGVEPDAIETYMRGESIVFDATPPDDQTADAEEASHKANTETPTGVHGVFDVFWAHEKEAALGLLEASIPYASRVARSSVGPCVMPNIQEGTLESLRRLAYGPCWMLRTHLGYSILFFVGTLIIWSWGGGSICRMTALQFAREERITVSEAHAFTRKRLFSGFVAAPCIPLVLVLIIMLLLVVGGLVLRLPVVGDLLSGLVFFLAILGGLAGAVFAIGIVAGGPLFWPAVAVEDQDGFDSFARALSYALTKHWKTALYGAIALVFTGVCWVGAHLFTVLALAMTRAGVGFGTAPFGLWEHEGVSKLDWVWPVAEAGRLYTPPDWSQLSWDWRFSALMIGFFVLMVIGVLWSFLASMFFTNSTVVFFLLRRDVDGTDLEDVAVDELAEGEDLPDYIEETGTPERSESAIHEPVSESTDQQGVPGDPPEPAGELPGQRDKPAEQDSASKKEADATDQSKTDDRKED